ncbi:MAG TPA: GEGP motif-containing diheme protein [Myxococcota bacterium]|nr:GEGP motif-containing diheme protein [Myxococcota bacterium]
MHFQSTISTRQSWLLISCIFFGFAACNSTEQDLVTSHSYKGHENVLDSNNFVSAYPSTLGTRLDDCQTCHQGKTFSYPSGTTTKTVFVNSCDYCHLITHPSADFIEAQPSGFKDTLNPYGSDYLAAGRTRKALSGIADKDSDGDSYSNKDEIADMKYPGDPDSKPGQDTAPMIIISKKDLEALPMHEEFLLANSHKQQYDNYASYRGVKIRDLLEHVGVDVEDAAFEGITIMAPDGYQKDFSVEQIKNAFPAGLFRAGLDNASLGTDCGFVEYPDELPSGLIDGGEIPGQQWLILAYERDGDPLQACNLDVTSGSINGEGPFRLVLPQSNPEAPDRGSKYSPTDCNDGWDFDENKDHNAGDMVRGVVVVRSNPLPAGYEDFDYQNGGWAYIDSESLVVYGHGVSP